MPLDVSITSPLIDTFHLMSLRGSEAISQAFSFQLELSCSNADIDFSQIVGKPIAATLTLPSGDSQYIHGIVTSFSQGAQSENGSSAYFAQLEPWFALLRMNTDHRIFQNQTVPQIVQKIFSDLSLSDFKNSLTASYTARDYCVQYGETTFDFISRLMESEGIFYFFTHSTTAHTLVLADDSSACAALPGIDTIRFNQTGRSWQTIDAMIDGGSNSISFQPRSPPTISTSSRLLPISSPSRKAPSRLRLPLFFPSTTTPVSSPPRTTARPQPAPT